MLEIALDLLAKCGGGRHGRVVFAFYSPIDSDRSGRVVNGMAVESLRLCPTIMTNE